MTGRLFSRSLKKYIRQEKARIRREFLDWQEQKKQIEALYKKLGANLAKKQRP
jgi:hypothetical protein